MHTKAQKKRKEKNQKRFNIVMKVVLVVICFISGIIYYKSGFDLLNSPNSTGTGGSEAAVYKITDGRNEAAVMAADNLAISEGNETIKNDNITKNFNSKNSSLKNNTLKNDISNNVSENYNNFLDINNSTLDKNDGIININMASVSELCTLKGIGEKRARDIIDYREKNNGFNCIEEIMNVKGIKEGIFLKIKDYIKVED